MYRRTSSSVLSWPDSMAGKQAFLREWTPQVCVTTNSNDLRSRDACAKVFFYCFAAWSLLPRNGKSIPLKFKWATDMEFVPYSAPWRQPTMMLSVFWATCGNMRTRGDDDISLRSSCPKWFDDGIICRGVEDSVSVCDCICILYILYIYILYYMYILYYYICTKWRDAISRLWALSLKSVSRFIDLTCIYTPFH